MADGGKKGKGGRPQKFTVAQKLMVYALHLKKFWAHEIVDILGKRTPPIKVSEDTVRSAIKFIRDEMPRTGDKESLFEAIDGCNQRIKELNIKAAALVKNEMMSHVYLGYLKAIREEEEFRSKLEGNLKMVFGLDHESFAGLWDIMNKGKEGEK